MDTNKHNGTILIAEDNPTNMKLIKDILEFEGYNIIEAHDGKAALNMIRKCKNDIDLILLDIQLPEINGFEVIKLLKSNDTTKNIPIFVVSAHAMESDIKKALNAGCNNFITKPINLESFVDKINSFFLHAIQR